MNLESKRRQYELVAEAKRRGFRNVDVIDDDLGRSASGTVARPGFQRLWGGSVPERVGAVLCLDASRLARNGRDWHHLLELCGLVEARVIDLVGVYDPGHPNDRLLLEMKGSISEFELNVLRTRVHDALRQDSPWRITHQRTHRICMASQGGFGIRSGSSDAVGDTDDLCTVSRTG